MADQSDYVVGLAVSATVGIAGVLFANRKRIFKFKKPSPSPPPKPKHLLKLERRRIPVPASADLGSKGHTRCWHSFYLHYVEGPDFKIETVALVVMLRAENEAETAEPDAIYLGYTQLEPAPTEARPMMKAGDSFYFAASLTKHPWDRAMSEKEQGPQGQHHGRGAEADEGPEIRKIEPSIARARAPIAPVSKKARAAAVPHPARRQLHS